MKKSILKAALTATLICIFLASYFLYSSSNVMRIVPLVSQLMAFARPLPEEALELAKPMPLETFRLDISADAYGFYSILEMIQSFSADKFVWSTSIPSYPPGTYVNFVVDVRDIDFGKEDAWTYHLSLKGLDRSQIEQNGATMFSVQCDSGEVSFVFSNSYHTLDITGVLTGKVYFLVDFSPDINFEYSGRRLAIDVHMGLT